MLEQPPVESAVVVVALQYRHPVLKISDQELQYVRKSSVIGKDTAGYPRLWTIVIVTRQNLEHGLSEDTNCSR